MDHAAIEAQIKGNTEYAGQALTFVRGTTTIPFSAFDVADENNPKEFQTKPRRSEEVELETMKSYFSSLTGFPKEGEFFSSGSNKLRILKSNTNFSTYKIRFTCKVS